MSVVLQQCRPGAQIASVLQVQAGQDAALLFFMRPELFLGALPTHIDLSHVARNLVPAGKGEPSRSIILNTQTFGTSISSSNGHTTFVLDNEPPRKNFQQLVIQASLSFRKGKKAWASNTIYLYS